MLAGRGVISHVAERGQILHTKLQFERWKERKEKEGGEGEKRKRGRERKGEMEEGLEGEMRPVTDLSSLGTDYGGGEAARNPCPS